jgi:hypothetical protein
LRIGHSWQELLHDGLRGQALIHRRPMGRMHSAGRNFFELH